MITISDVDLQKAWLDVYATSGIAVGTAVDIQNKGSDMVFVQVKGSAPAADNQDGYVILPYEKLQIGAGGAGLWAYGAGELTVTEAVPLAITASASAPVSTVSSADRVVQDATIAINTSVSDALDMDKNSLLGFIMPSAWTTAGITIEVSTDNSNWFPARDAYGSTVGYISSPVVSNAYSVDVQALLPWRYIRFRSGTTASPVVQTTARTIPIVKRVLA